MSTKKKANLAPTANMAPIILTPPMILGAIDRHMTEFTNAVKNSDPLQLDATACLAHLNQVVPLLQSLQRTQAEHRAAQEAALAQHKAQQQGQNANGSEARN
jgi:hypothetical protein